MHFFSVLVFPVAEKDCKQCPSVLQELENIDDEAEDNGKLVYPLLFSGST